MTELYLKYPLKIYGDNMFYVLVTQTGDRFATSMLSVKDKDFCIRQDLHLTLHQAILWANNELEYLAKLNEFVPNK